MPDRMKIFLSYGAAFAVGVVSALAYPFVIPWTGEAPLFDRMPRELLILLVGIYLFRLAQSEHCDLQVALRAFVAGLGFFLALLFWIDFAMHFYADIPHGIAIAVVGLLSAYCALFWAAVPVTTRWLLKHLAVGRVLAFAASITAMEWLRSFLFSGFPWGLWGYSQARNHQVLQLAALGGVYLVSWLIACVAALTAIYLAARHTRRALRAGLALATVVIIAYAVGWVRFRRPLDDDGPFIKVALIQGNIDQHLKNESMRHERTILDTYLHLSRQAVQNGVDLLVWPEAAWPGYLPRAVKEIPGLDLKIPVLLGASLLAEAPTGYVVQNASLFVNKDNLVQGSYAKQHLVPFGEYVPLRWLIPVGRIVPDIADTTPGDSSAPLGQPGIGVLICYDGIFPEIARDEVRAGAKILANLTNDAWYRISSAPYQHRDFYAFRAVETDRYLLRAANTGLSVFVDPKGRYFGQTRLNEEVVTTSSIAPRQTKTPYVRFGNWAVAINLGFFAAAGLKSLNRWWNRRRERVANSSPHR
jgi:apolipoprotein N-acyltransferase